MKKSWGDIIVGIVTSLIGTYLYGEVFPSLNTVMTNYPFECFVVITLTVIMVLLIIVTTHLFKRKVS